MYSTSAFYIGIIRNAVDEFSVRFTGFGTASVLPTHITVETGAMGIAQSANREAVEAVERIAWRLEREERERMERQINLRALRLAGAISEEEFLSVYYE